MQLVAANKLVKAQDMLSENMFVLDSAQQMMDSILSVAKNNELNKDNGTKILLLITSDKGLCGGYNSSIIKNLRRDLQALQENDSKFKLIILGKKGKDFFQNEIEFECYDNTVDDYLEIVDTVSTNVIESLSADPMNKGGQVILYFNNYQNTLTYTNTKKSIWPLLEVNNLKAYEVEQVNFLDSLKLYFSVSILNALLSGVASELSSRMLAMDNATRNADTLIEKLTLNLNRSRQAIITKELIEIISGAEAL